MQPHDISLTPIILDDTSGPQDHESNDVTVYHIEPFQDSNALTTAEEPVLRPMDPQPSTSTQCNLPSPFKKVLCWPEPPKKKSRRETYPGFVLSESWREYHQNKQKKKSDSEDMKKKRAAERERKKQEKEEMKKRKAIENNTRTRRKAVKKKVMESSSSEEEWVPSGERSEANESLTGLFEQSDNQIVMVEEDIIDNHNEIVLSPNVTFENLKVQCTETNIYTPELTSLHCYTNGNLNTDNADLLNDIRSEIEATLEDVEIPQVEQEQQASNVVSTIDDLVIPHIPPENPALNLEHIQKSHVVPGKQASVIMKEGSFVIAVCGTHTRNSEKKSPNTKQLFHIVGITNEQARAYVLKPLNRLRNVFMKRDTKLRIINTNQVIEGISRPLIFGRDSLNTRYQFPNPVSVDV